MLIGIDANEANLTSNRVGINQYAFDLLHALYNLKTDHQFVIYLKNPTQADLPLPKSSWSYRILPFPKLWTQTRLPWDLFIHSPRPDIFFSMTHYAPRWSPVPTVVAVMDLGFLQSPGQFTAKDLNQLTSWTSYSVHQAYRVIAISENTKKDIVSAYHIDRDKIIVTYLGYDSRLFKPTNRPSVLTKYGISKPYFLFLGSLKPSKNVEGLVRAFSSMPQDYNLVIAGKKGWLYDQIFALVRHLGLESRIIFTGFVEEEEVPVLMSLSQAFVMPSFYEGFGIPVLEAMACGTPVVTSRVASLPEVAGNAAIYVDPTDALSISRGLNIALSSERSRFVKAGLERVKSFSWDKCARQTLLCLETATANP